MSSRLRHYAVQHLGLDPDADDAEYKRVIAQSVRTGRTWFTKRGKRVNPADIADPLALAERIAEKQGGVIHHRDLPSADEIDAAADSIVSQLHTRKGFSNMRSAIEPDSAVQPMDIFKHAGRVDVKAPSARYSTKRYTGKHHRTGQEVLRDGSPVDTPSQRDNAMTGVYFRHLALRKGYDIRPLDAHEQELLKELYTDSLWCGDVGGQYYAGAKLSDIFRRKGTDLISDNTSGGTNLVPYFYDTDIVTFPLLNGELFPFVSLKEMNKSNSVHTASLANLTANWGASEGGASAASSSRVSFQMHSCCASL